MAEPMAEPSGKALPPPAQFGPGGLKKGSALAGSPLADARQPASPETSPLLVGAGGERARRQRASVNDVDLAFEGQAAKQGQGMRRGSIILKRQHHGDQDPRQLMARVRDDLVGGLGGGLGGGLPAAKDAPGKARQTGSNLMARRAVALPQVASPTPKDKPHLQSAVTKGILGSASMPDLSKALQQAPRPRGPPANFKRGSLAAGRADDPLDAAGQLGIAIDNAGLSPFEAGGAGFGGPPRRQLAAPAVRKAREAANAAFGLGQHVRRHAAMHPDEQGPNLTVTPFG